MQKGQSVKVKIGGSWIAATFVKANSGGSVATILDQDYQAYRKGDKVTVGQWECKEIQQLR